MTTLNIGSGCVITNGPSREELFDSLRLFDEHRLVTFELEPRHPNFHNWRVKLKAQIAEIGAEDGSGRSWIVRAYFRDDEDHGYLLSDHGLIQFYYHDQSRKGQVIKSQTS